MNANDLRDAIDAIRIGVYDDLEPVLKAAERIWNLEQLDEKQACIHVWNSGLGEKPWMFEIRRAGVLYGMFMDVANRYSSRAEAETQAIIICESMINGTFEETFTHLRTKCPRCKGSIGLYNRECEANCQ